MSETPIVSADLVLLTIMDCFGVCVELYEDQEIEEVVEQEKKNHFYDLMVKIREKREFIEQPKSLEKQEEV